MKPIYAYKYHKTTRLPVMRKILTNIASMHKTLLLMYVPIGSNVPAFHDIISDGGVAIQSGRSPRQLDGIWTQNLDGWGARHTGGP